MSDSSLPVLSEAPILEPGNARLIFVSYRVDPDQPIAEALKTLIETAFDPPPKVFVSGAGGLRPSALTFRAQLDSAAKSAVAFVGIITNASKDRAWIHFEAGAAWGRTRLYAPILVDVPLVELGDTIGAYQATDARDANALRMLLDDLAELAGAKIARRKLAYQLRAFERTLVSYTSGDSGGGKAEGGPVQAADDDDPVLAAAVLLANGQKEEATEKFDLLLSSGDQAVVSRASILRVVFEEDRSTTQRLVGLELLSDQAKNHPEYLCWHAVYESDPAIASEEAERYLFCKGPRYASQIALKRLVTLKSDLGKTKEAMEAVGHAMGSTDRGTRTDAASLYLEVWKSSPAANRFAAATVGVLGECNSEHMRTLCEIAASKGWSGLGIYLAARYEEFAHDGSSSNVEGMAFDSAACPGLAYAAYERAVAKGVSVSKVNMANLLRRGAVPSAALALLTGQDGGTDAADPAYPHGIRKEIETDLAAERVKADEARIVGRRLFRRICGIVGQAVRTATPATALVGRYRSEGKEFAVTSDPRADAGAIGEALFHWAFPGTALICSEQQDSVSFFLVRDQEVVGIATKGSDEGTLVKWERVL